MDNNDRVLFVEGQDDEHVVKQLYLRSNSTLPFHIENKSNVNTLLGSIRQEVRVSGREAVGFLVDANECLNDVASRLTQAGLDVLRDPEPAGTIIDGTTRTPCVGIWLMPNNTSPGELEDFVSEMIPDDNPVWPRSQLYIAGIPEDEREFSQKKIIRATVHAWLATRKEPKKMGSAIRAQDLRVDGPLSTKFANWLQQLFG